MNKLVRFFINRPIMYVYFLFLTKCSNGHNNIKNPGNSYPVFFKSVYAFFSIFCCLSMGKL